MKNEINAVLENMTTTIPEPEDYPARTVLLYCGKCLQAKKAYFAPDKAAIARARPPPGRVRLPENRREEREAAEKRREHLDTVEELKRRGFTDPPCGTGLSRTTTAGTADRACHRYVEHWEDMRTDNIGCLFWGSVGTGQKLPCRLYRKRPHGEKKSPSA